MLLIRQEDAANKVTYKYTVDSHFLFYLENSTGFVLVILFCSIYLPPIKVWSVKILSDIKPVRGAKNCWSKE